MNNFALIGIAGYIAPRHLKAIKETGNNLIACCDPHDSVGVLDQYFPNTAYFKEIERFDRHLEKLRRSNHINKIDYISICSPNHLHDAHVRLALRNDASAVCEKPLVLNPWNIDALLALEQEYNRRVYSILQLRLHPAVVKLKDLFSHEKNTKNDVELTYITSRGTWYDYSWKGDVEKSGGIILNIGIHFFDMLSWLFGETLTTEVYLNQPHTASGYIEYQNANVRWFLSISKNDLPLHSTNKSTFRSILVNGVEVDFTAGFTDLHVLSYSEILAGRGYGIEEARKSIEDVYMLRTSRVQECLDKEKAHPLYLEKRSNAGV